MTAYALPDLPPFRTPEDRAATVFLCAGAGWGNRRAAEALAERTGSAAGRIAAIEDFLPPVWVRRDFGRYRRICERAPWLLGWIHAFPVNYALKTWLAGNGREDRETAERIGAWARGTGARHLVVTNHRAAFWAAKAKAAGALDCRIWCAITDYALSPGWRHIDRERVDGSFGPVDASELPEPMRKTHLLHPIAVLPAFEAAGGTAEEPPSRQRPDAKLTVIVTGGGWGLGRLDRAAETLVRADADVRVRVFTGENRSLDARLAAAVERSGGRISLQGGADLALAIGEARAVVCRPGAMTLTEARAAGKKIFLLPGLPGIEPRNARYAAERFGAEPFAVPNYLRWKRKLL
jgi:hypothetical protein